MNQAMLLALLRAYLARQGQTGARGQHYRTGGRGPFGGNPNDPASNFPYTPETWRNIQAENYKFWNPGFIGEESGAGPFHGMYGWGGFTRGANPNPYMNPRVGNFNMFNMTPGTAFSKWGSLQNDPNLMSFLSDPRESGMREFLGGSANPGGMSREEMDERFSGGYWGRGSGSDIGKSWGLYF